MKKIQIIVTHPVLICVEMDILPFIFASCGAVRFSANGVIPQRKHTRTCTCTRKSHFQKMNNNMQCNKMRKKEGSDILCTKHGPNIRCDMIDSKQHVGKTKGKRCRGPDTIKVFYSYLISNRTHTEIVV